MTSWAESTWQFTQRKKKKKKKDVPGNLVPFFLLSLVLGPNENMADFYCNLDKNVVPPPSPPFLHLTFCGVSDWWVTVMLRLSDLIKRDTGRHKNEALLWNGAWGRSAAALLWLRCDYAVPRRLCYVEDAAQYESRRREGGRERREGGLLN